MSTKKARKTKKGGKLKRWTSEEIEFLQARFRVPFKKVYREYRKAGYKRTERAVSVKFYSLKKTAGKTTAGGGGNDRVRQAALDLAARHDLATLQAAVQIREVLERLD